MARSRDWDELQHTWLEWRRHTGQYIRDLYDQLAQLTNQAARLNSKLIDNIISLPPCNRLQIKARQSTLEFVYRIEIYWRSTPHGALCFLTHKATEQNSKSPDRVDP